MFLSVFAEVFSKGLLLTGDAAGITKTVFLPLVEGASAAGAVLRPDPAKLGAGVTVGAACRAAINIVPVHAHEALPVRVIAEIIHPLTQEGVQYGEILTDFGASSGEVESLSDSRLWSSVAPRAVAHILSNLVSVFG